MRRVGTDRGQSVTVLTGAPFSTCLIPLAIDDEGERDSGYAPSRVNPGR
jgi:hypothetical protein